MKTYVQVKMKAEFIYDLLLYHTYSRLPGFLVNLLGLTVIMAGGYLLKQGRLQLHQVLVYLAGGLLILCYTPVNLKLQARRLMEQPRYASPIVYGFDEGGIREQIGMTVNTVSWENVEMVVSTPKDIVFYVKDASALVLPKESFGKEFMPVMELVLGNVKRERVFIRGVGGGRVV